MSGQEIHTPPPGTSQLIGPTDIRGLNFGLNYVQGGNVQVRGLNTETLSYARRLLDAYTPSNTYYMSALIRADNLSGNLNVQAMTGFTVTVSYGAFDGSSSFPGAIFGFSGDGSKVDLVVRHRDDDAVMQNSVLLEDAQDGETYFIVVKIEYDAIGTLERLTAWLNPAEYDEEDATPVFTTTGQMLTSAGQMNYAGFWVHNFTSSIDDYIQFDELKLATEWNDAVAVPHPSQLSTLTQNFSVPGDNFMPIHDSAGSETPQRPAFDITPTGWRWGGYSNANRVEIDQNTRGDVTFDELIFKQNSPKAYAYTIFSSEGTNEPDSFVDMTAYWASMDFKISAIYHGNFEHASHPDNGSGLPYPGDQYYAPVLRALIRDANGDWYGSSLFLPSSYQGTHGDLNGTILEYSLAFEGVDWYIYSQEEIDNLNALAGGDAIPLTHSFDKDPNSPDLTEVSGIGVYVWNSPTWSVGGVAFTEISLNGAGLPVYWGADELADMAAEWLVSEIAWEETMDADPAASNDWVMRSGITGDYIIAGGEMLIFGNSYGNWRLDTNPPTNFGGEVLVNARMKATTGSDTTEGSRSGINFWINLDANQSPYGAINYSIVLNGANQYVEFISDWTEGVSWPPAEYTRITGDGATNFNSSMLDIELLIKPTDPNESVPEPTTFDVNYTISDQSNTTATGVFRMNRRAGIGEGIATILTGGAEGVVDYISIDADYIPLTDRTGDDFVNYLDFAWLADRWLTIRQEPWP